MYVTNFNAVLQFGGVIRVEYPFFNANKLTLPHIFSFNVPKGLIFECVVQLLLPNFDHFVSALS